MMVVNHLTFSWVMYNFEYRIRPGDFSFALLRPLHPIHSDIADNVGYKLLTLLIMAPAVILLSLAFGADFHPSLWAALGFLPALALAFLVRFLLEWAFAMAAFWTTRVDALNQVYFVASLFFSGLIAPLSLLPGPLRTISALLPFRWLLAFPVDMALGRLSQREALIGFVAQLAWLAVTVALLRFLWPAGVRRYAAVGQ
jgi:ABC-2 type transport system permease protein